MFVTWPIINDTLALPARENEGAQLPRTWNIPGSRALVWIWPRPVNIRSVITLPGDRAVTFVWKSFVCSPSCRDDLMLVFCEDVMSGESADSQWLTWTKFQCQTIPEARSKHLLELIMKCSFWVCGIHSLRPCLRYYKHLPPFWTIENNYQDYKP